MEDYKARFANPYTAAERGYIDDVIVPHETRPRLIAALHTLQTKREPGPSASTATSRCSEPMGSRRVRRPIHVPRWSTAARSWS